MTNDQLHKEALSAYVKLARARGQTEHYNEVRRENTALFGGLASQIWEALERGESVGGAATKEDWCKLAGVKMRWTQTAIKRHRVKVGMEQAEAQSVRVTANLDRATHVIWGGRKYTREEFERLLSAPKADGTKPEEPKTRPAGKKVHFNNDGRLMCHGSQDAFERLTTTDKAGVTCKVCLDVIRDEEACENNLRRRAGQVHSADPSRKNFTRCSWFNIDEVALADDAREVTCPDCKASLEKAVQKVMLVVKDNCPTEEVV